MAHNPEIFFNLLFSFENHEVRKSLRKLLRKTKIPLLKICSRALRVSVPPAPPAPLAVLPCWCLSRRLSLRQPPSPWRRRGPGSGGLHRVLACFFLDGPFSNRQPHAVAPVLHFLQQLPGARWLGAQRVHAAPPSSESWLITHDPPTVGRLVIVTGPFQFLAVSFVSAVLVASWKLSGFLVSVRTWQFRPHNAA